MSEKKAKKGSPHCIKYIKTKGDKKMSMKSASKAECDFCMNRGAIGKYNICQSTICKLNDKSLTPLKRIKAHCLSCIPEHDLRAVQECTGRLIDDKTCPLHFYRLGKNPKRAGIGRKGGNPILRQNALTQQPFVYQKSLKTG